MMNTLQRDTTSIAGALLPSPQTLPKLGPSVAGRTSQGPYEITHKPSAESLGYLGATSHLAETYDPFSSSGLRLPSRMAAQRWRAESTPDEEDPMPDAKTNLVITLPTGAVIEVPGQNEG
jgi:hypothetical protein